jgi:hypothetical protein
MPVAETCKPPVKDVHCPNCKRYVGAFVGKAQCSMQEAYEMGIEESNDPEDAIRESIQQ